MARKFDIPIYYRSSLVGSIKQARQNGDPRKRNLSPSILDLGSISFKIARHFGFCFGVENAIEIAYRALEENPGKRVFLLSEMIHNPRVNADLTLKGVRFILSPEGQQRIPFEELKPEDVVIIPAFGTTVELFDKLASLGVKTKEYNATCPFVEKVWKRAAELGEVGYTVIIHGKHSHEETRATFSHAALSAPSLVIRDLEEAEILATYLRRERHFEDFDVHFRGRYSVGFIPLKHLERIGVVNQTTMLATETLAISRLLKQALCDYYGEEHIKEHFADTRDTLCYATSENQDAIQGLLESGGDLALVVGGYNSSNTSHLVELCEEKVPTYFISDASEIIDAKHIRHLDWKHKEILVTKDWLPKSDERLEVLLTAGASCPDAVVDEVITRVAKLCGVSEEIPEAVGTLVANYGG